MSSLLIEVNNLSRYYGNHCAVDDISFTLEKGEVLGFLGPNGAGKTSTMQMLCGNLAPSSGQIKINSIDILDQPQQAKQYLGYLPDTPPLYKELTVNEFLEYCAQLHKVPFRQINKVINTTKTRCGLNEVSERLITNLSKGYQQRVGIAQAILHTPEVIVLDEPTVGLDPIQIKEIRTLIKELGSEHGIILSTHILSEVQESCSHVQIINQGKLIFNESIDHLNHQLNTSTIKVETRTPLNLDNFANISSITSIENKRDTHYLFHYASNENPTEQLAEIIVNSGCGLLELSATMQSLEDIFIALTTKNNNA